MLFITNRLPEKNQEPALNKPFVFDLKKNAARQSVFFCESTGPDQHEEIGAEPFLNHIKAMRVRQVLIFIHGYSNMPAEVLQNAQELQRLSDQEKAGELVVIPVIWPCDNNFGIVKDYWDDQKSADQSAFALARVLEKFIAWRDASEFNPEGESCLKRINILAHSMGNRVLRETLSVWKKYDRPQGLPLLFRNTFLVAADIANESLHKGEAGELICDASRNVVVYYAADDLAMRASKVANLKNLEATRRLGHTGPEDRALTPRNVYSVDCDSVNMDYDPMKGHSYYRADNNGQPGLVFKHLFEAMKTGRVLCNADREHEI